MILTIHTAAVPLVLLCLFIVCGIAIFLARRRGKLVNFVVVARIPFFCHFPSAKQDVPQDSQIPEGNVTTGRNKAYQVVTLARQKIVMDDNPVYGLVQANSRHIASQL